MEVRTFTVGPFAENTYLLIEKSDALLIDPGFFDEEEYERFLRVMKKHQASLQAIILTHAHIDHVLGLQRVKDDFDVPVYLSDKDRYLWNNLHNQAKQFGFADVNLSFEPKILPVKHDWSVGVFSFDVLYTPGHAPDHVSLYSNSDGFLIAGDILFKEGIGRTDLYKGDSALLKKSIEEQLYTLPDATLVYPGHGAKTTIGHEKKANPFVRLKS